MLTTKTKMAIAQILSRTLLLQRRLVGLGPEARVVRSGLRWNLDLREGIDLSIYLFGRFERDTVRAYERLLKPGDTVIDIGANIGAHTLQLARCVSPGGRVVAIEPTEYAYGKLTQLLENNRPLSNNVVAHQAMLTEKTDAGLVPELYSSWSVEGVGESQHPMHLGTGKATRGARAVALDDLVRELGLERIDLIKLDVDGWEMEVLRGARATLGKLKPSIVFEVAPYTLEERGYSAQGLIDELASHGYRFATLDGADVPDVKALLARIPHGAGHNLIARA
jgi:FkbM family methyltransferase